MSDSKGDMNKRLITLLAVAMCAYGSTITTTTTCTATAGTVLFDETTTTGSCFGMENRPGRIGLGYLAEANARQGEVTTRAQTGNWDNEAPVFVAVSASVTTTDTLMYEGSGPAILRLMYSIVTTSLDNSGSLVASINSTPAVFIFATLSPFTQFGFRDVPIELGVPIELQVTAHTGRDLLPVVAGNGRSGIDYSLFPILQAATPVPEPSSFLLAGAGIALLMVTSRYPLRIKHVAMNDKMLASLHRSPLASQNKQR